MELFFYFLCSAVISFVTTDIPRPRGVSVSKAPLYKPDKTFTCLDGSKTIDYGLINDDYCDCDDGSDEPGTSACPRGTFHCTNPGHRPLNIPSSRVNDGICDCCDGTDEYDSDMACQNTCRELGRAAREAAERLKQLGEAGYQKKLEYIEQGKQQRRDKQQRVEELENEKEELESRKLDLQALKEEAEKPEKEAKDAFHKAWEEEKAKRQAEKEKQNSIGAFSELDANADGVVSVEEIQKHLEFDIDSSGEVSLEEAKEYLEDNMEVNLLTFEEHVWPNIKDIYKSPPPPQEATTPAPPAPEEIPPPPLEEGDLDHHPDDEDSEEDEHDDHDDEDEDDEEPPAEATPVTDEDKMPEYTDDIKQLIEAADKARDEYNEFERQYNDKDREISDIRNYLGLDLGPDDEFFPLKDQCYEYTDREYTYKLCPFSKASQRSKNGGGETSLGSWGMWDGPAENKYLAMKYERGQNCWNGPDRSVRVSLSCGMENKLTSASEPNRCEYAFTFETPAVCQKASVDPPQDPYHTEL